LAHVAEEVGPEAYKRDHFREAVDIFRKMSTSPHFETFLTLRAYRKIV
jgi:malate synthase